MDIDYRRPARTTLAPNEDARWTPGAETTCGRDLTHLRARAKFLIVRAALWGLMPVKVADWLIRYGGLRDA